MSKKSGFRIVGGGVLDAPAVKSYDFCIFRRIRNIFERAVGDAAPYK